MRSVFGIPLRRRSAARAAAGLVILLLALAGPLPSALATVMVPLSIEDMALQSACVLRGRVLSSRAAWDGGHQRIYTYTEIEVLDAIHSPAQLPSKVSVRTLGGEVGEIGMKVSGTEKFTLGEEVVVFLRRDPVDASSFQVVGMSQGKYHIEHEAKGRVVAIPSVEGLAFARPDASGTLKVDPAAPSSERIPLGDLRRRIQAAIAEQRTPNASESGLVPPSAPIAPSPPATRASPR